MKTHYLKVLGLVLCLSTSFSSLHAQVKIGNNPQTINAASLLELESSDKAFVIPRMNTVQMNSIVPLEGAIIYNTEAQCLHYFDGLVWINICEAFGNSITFSSESLENPGNFETITITQTTPTNFNFEVGILNASNIQDGSIISPKITDGAVTLNKLATNSVDNSKILNRTIQAGKLAPGLPNQVLQTNITGTAALWSNLNANSISGDNLTAGDGSIVVTNGVGATLLNTNIRVTDLGITTLKLADDAVDNLKLADNAVQSENILDLTIQETDLADDAVTTSKISNNAISTPKLQDDAVTTDKIGTAGLTDANKILGTNIAGDPEWQDAAQIATSLGEDITSANGSITGVAPDAALVAMNLEVNVDDATLEVNAINGLQIKDAGVTTDKINAAAVDNSKLADDAVTTAKIGTLPGDENKILGTNISGDPEWQNAAQIAASLGEDVTSTNGSITGVAPDAALVAMNLEVNVDDATLEVNAINGLQIKDAGVTRDKIDADAVDNSKLADDAVQTENILDANVTDIKLDKPSISLTGFGVPTADLSMGTFKLTDVVDPTDAQDAATKNYVDGAVGTINTLTDGSIYLGNGLNSATQVAISGDATLDNTGVLTIANDAITTTKILNANVTDIKLDKANISLTGFGVPTADLSMGTFKLTDVVDPTAAQDAATKNYVDGAVGTINTLTDGSIYIGNAGNSATQVALSGDATLDNTGILTIENDAITTLKIADNNITPAKIEEGIDGQILTTDASGDVVWADPAFSAVTTDATIVGDGNATALSLADNAVTNAKLADNAVNTVELVNDAVTTLKIADDNVTPAKIEEGTDGQILTTDASGDVIWAAPAFSAVTTDATIDGDGITTALSLANDAVTNAKLADNAVNTLEIANDAITTLKIADDNVTPAKIEEGTDGQILTTDASGDVIWAAPAFSAVTTDATIVGDGNATALSLADNAITNAKLADNAVNTVEIVNDAVTTLKISDDNVTPAKIEEGTDGQILTTNASGDVIWAAPAFSAVTTDATIVGDGNATALSLADNAVTNAKLADNAVNTVEIVNDAVTTLKIADDNVTPAKIEEGTDGQILTTNASGDVIWAAPAFSAVTTDATIVGDGNATALSLADNAVTNAKLADNAVNTVEIVNDAVTTLKISDDNVTPAKIKEGTDGQILTTNASGDVVWANPAAATLPATSGSIFFSDGSGGILENNTELFWDNSGPTRLGIGTNTPEVGSKLQVTGPIRSEGYISTFGTALNPAYTFRSSTEDDRNTGMYRAAADEIGFSAGGIEALNIDETANNTTVTIREKLKLEGNIEDINNSTGSPGQILTSTSTGTEWKNPAVLIMGKANGSNSLKVNGATVAGLGGGINTVTFNTALPDDNYIIQLTVRGDFKIYVTDQQPGSFTVTTINNSTGLADVTEWYFTITDF